MFLDGEVKFPPVTIKLHWPDRWCKECGQETEYLPLELYRCPSCGLVTVGRTEHVEGAIRTS